MKAARIIPMENNNCMFGVGLEVVVMMIFVVAAESVFELSLSKKSIDKDNSRKNIKYTLLNLKFKTLSLLVFINKPYQFSSKSCCGNGQNPLAMKMI